MENKTEQMEIAKVSSKGQLVIPQNIRKNLKIIKGNMFAIASCDNTLVLKRIENPLTQEDFKTMKMVDEAWQDIEKGRYKKFSRDAFLKKLERW